MISLPLYRQAAEDKNIHISAAPLDLIAMIGLAHDPGAGAIVVFSGDVREGSPEKKVSYLEYEAHVSMATKMIAQILHEVKLRWSLKIALARHRIGKVPVGESAVIVITGSAHRREAYAANRFIIDKIKHEVPIWKCEYFMDGTKEWGGNCNCSKLTGDPGLHVYEDEW